MKRSLTLAIAGVISVVLSAAPIAAQTEAEVNARIDEVAGDSATFQPAFDAIKFAVSYDDAATFASLIFYPFRTEIDGERVTIDDEEEFIADYPKIVTPAIKQAITDQTYETLFVNQDGVAVGDGNVWFRPVCTDKACEFSYWLVDAINQPE